MRKVWGHFKTITKHKWLVFKLSIRAGIPWRGFVHDLSKYSWTEFKEGVKYYAEGKRSPNGVSKELVGYSYAWNHHTRKNKHHHQYWYDYDCKLKNPVMPYKYTAEMICDDIAACMNYQDKDYKNDSALNYFNKKTINLEVNDKIKEVLKDIYTQLAKNGIKVINKKNLKKTYSRHIYEK